MSTSYVNQYVNSIRDLPQKWVSQPGILHLNVWKTNSVSVSTAEAMFSDVKFDTVVMSLTFYLRIFLDTLSGLTFLSIAVKTHEKNVIIRPHKTKFFVVLVLLVCCEGRCHHWTPRSECHFLNVWAHLQSVILWSYTFLTTNVWMFKRK